MNLSHKLTIQLIRYEIAQIPVDQALLDSVTDDVLSLVYDFSVEQDVAYIVGCALNKLGLLSGDIKAAFFNEQLASVYRDEQFRHDADNISKLLSDSRIAHILLKGAVIKDIYPKSEMRTSCDIDILIKDNDLDMALEILYQDGYSYVSKTKHDVMLSSPSGTIIELHYTLNEYEFAADEVLNNAWDYAEKKAEYEYQFDTAFFTFYLVSHIARHMYTGGCGIRPFLDLKLVFEKMEFDKDNFNDLINKTSLTKFCDMALNLAELWFGECDDKNDDLQDFANYVLNAGIYGNMTNKISVINEKANSKTKYVRSIFFPSYNAMAERYTVLKNAPYLLPVMYVSRWIEAVFKGRTSKGVQYLKASSAVNGDKQKEVTDLLKNLELM